MLAEPWGAVDGEDEGAFLQGLQHRLGKIPMRIGQATLCMNAYVGWDAVRRRLAMARAIARSLHASLGKLVLMSPCLDEPRVTVELLTLIELLRRDHPALEVSIQALSAQAGTAPAGTFSGSLSQSRFAAGS